jgi:hypothetical protein
MNTTTSNETCSLCGGTATCRDDAIYLYCRDCESVSDMTLPDGSLAPGFPSNPTDASDTPAGERSANLGDTA